MAAARDEVTRAAPAPARAAARAPFGSAHSFARVAARSAPGVDGALNIGWLAGVLQQAARRLQICPAARHSIK